jgi:hypothetical protein
MGVELLNALAGLRLIWPQDALGMIANPKLDKNVLKNPELVAVFCELDNFYNLG